jgi:hypothetical protein
VHLGEWGGAQPQTGGAPYWRPPCPTGAPLEKNGRFRWAAGGCWGLQIDGAWGRKNAPRGNGRKFRGRAQQRGRESNGKHPFKRQFTHHYPLPPFATTRLLYICNKGEAAPTRQGTRTNTVPEHAHPLRNWQGLRLWPHPLEIPA